MFLVRNVYLRWSFFSCEINVREYRRSNKTWTVQQNCLPRAHKMKKATKTPQNPNATQYLLETTMRKPTQMTYIRYEPQLGLFF
jgi:hypothetical protein